MCQVDGCQVQATTQTLMGVHFVHRQMGDTVIIVEEVNLPHLLCPFCDMLFPWLGLNSLHLVTSQCYNAS